MRFGALALGLAVSLLASTATAGRWALASYSDNLAIGIDWDSIRATGSVRSAWTTWVESQTHETGGPRYDYALKRVSVNCDAETITTYSRVAYLIDKSEPVANFTDPYPSANAAVPDTIGAAMLATLCGDGPDGGIDTANEFAKTARMWVFTSGE